MTRSATPSMYRAPTSDDFKVVERAGEGAAMAQLKEQRYADK